MRLGIWVISVTENILGDSLKAYMQDQHILGSLKEAVNKIISGVFVMQRQNINICLTVERTITPYLLKALTNLLEQVFEVGLDHDAEQ